MSESTDNLVNLTTIKDKYEDREGVKYATININNKVSIRLKSNNTSYYPYYFDTKYYQSIYYDEINNKVTIVLDLITPRINSRNYTLIIDLNTRQISQKGNNSEAPDTFSQVINTYYENNKPANIELEIIDIEKTGGSSKVTFYKNGKKYTRVVQLNKRGTKCVKCDGKLVPISKLKKTP